MACDNLATKSDVQALEQKINSLKSEIQTLSKQLSQINAGISAILTAIAALRTFLDQKLSPIASQLINIYKALTSLSSKVDSGISQILTAIKNLKNAEIDYGKIEGFHRTTRSEISGVIARYIVPIERQLQVINSQCVNIYKAITQLNRENNDLLKTISNILSILSSLKSLFSKPVEIDYSKIEGYHKATRSQLINVISQYVNPLSQKLDSISAQCVNIYKAIKNFNLNDIKNHINNQFNSLRESNASYFANLRTFIKQLNDSNDINRIKDFLDLLIRENDGILEDHLKEIKGIVNYNRGKINYLVSRLDTLFSQLWSRLNAIEDRILAELKRLSLPTVDLKGIENALKNANNTLSQIKQYQEQRFGVLQESINNIYNYLKNLKFPQIDLRGIENAIQNANNTLSQIKQYNEQQFSIAREASNNIYKQGKDNYEQLRKLINDQFNSLRTALTGYVQQILNKIDGIQFTDYAPSDWESIKEIIIKTFSILGGTAWDAGINFNPELDIKARANYAFNISSSGTGTSQMVNCISLIDYLQYLHTVVYYRLGFQDYPIQVTEDLTDNTRIREIYLPTLSSFNTWQTKQIDAILGQFPFRIDIEDNDLIQTGDQPLQLEFPNVAETLAELTGLLITVKAFLEANLNASMRTLAEVGSTKTQGVSTYYLLEAIQDYLGFKTKQKTIDVEFLFNPRVGVDENIPETLSEFLTNTKQKVKIEDSDDKHTLEGHMAILKEAAAIIKAVHWRKFNLNDTSELKNFFKNIVDFIGDEEGEKESDAFKEFLERVERGFIDETGISDGLNPYGRPYDQRPKIRRLGKEDIQQ